jgi:hypothetical protein
MSVQAMEKARKLSSAALPATYQLEATAAKERLVHDRLKLLLTC